MLHHGRVLGAVDRFVDRADAGRRLAEAVAEAGLDVDLVLGMARGGVPVAAEVARHTGAQLGVLVVRKVGAPRHRELAVGAVADTGTVVWDTELLADLGLAPESMGADVVRVQDEVERQLATYGREERWDGSGAVVIVDDGLATGTSAVAAVRSVRERAGAGRPVVLAVPVASRQGLQRLRPETDRALALEVPWRFGAVSTWYDDFRQVSDDEVLAALGRA